MIWATPRWRGRRRAALVAATVALAHAPAAGATTLDFEDHPDGTLLATQYQARGVTFKTTIPAIGSLPGGTANLPSVREVGPQARSGTQVANLRQFGCGEFCQVRVFAELSSDRSVVEAYAGDYDAAQETAQVTMTAYDAAGAVVGKATADVTGGAAFLSPLRVESELPAIRYVIFQSAQNRRVGIDDLGFHPDPVSVGNEPPTASLTFEPAQPEVGSEVTFRSTSSDPDGPIARHEWDLDGDGELEVDSGAEPAVTHRFAAPARRTVRLRVTDQAGESDDALREITVVDAPPPPDPAEPVPPPSPPDAPRPIQPPPADPGCRSEVSFATVAVVGRCLIPETRRLEGAGNESRSEVELFVSRSPVSVNGIRLVPKGGTRIEVIPSQQRIRSAGGTGVVRRELLAESPSVPPVVLGEGRLRWALKTKLLVPLPGRAATHRRCEAGPKPAPEGSKLGEFDIGSLGRMLGLKLTGTAAVYVRPGGSTIDAHVEMPELLHGLGRITGDVRLETTERGGLELASLDVTMAQGYLGPVEVKCLQVSYRHASKVWGGQAHVVLPTVQKHDIEVDVEVSNGSLTRFHAAVQNLNIAVGPGMFLQRIGFDLDRRGPLTLVGDAGLSGGPQLAGHAAVRINGKATFKLSEDWVLRVDADVHIAGLRVGEGYLEYQRGGVVKLGANFLFREGIYKFEGNVSGGLDGRAGTFNVEGEGKACMGVSVAGFDGYVCVTARGLVSSNGFAVCGGVDLPFPFPDVMAGFGKRWGGGLTPFTGCDLGEYRAHIAQSGTQRMLAVKPGERALGIQLAGPNGAPQVTLTGPDGQSFTTPADPRASVKTDRFWAIQDPDQKRTYVLMLAPSPGAWSIRSTDESRPISHMASSRALPEPRVDARVVGRGERRTLAYRVKPLPGQTVTFAERSAAGLRTIGRARGAAGRIVFTPGDGPRRRRIVALIEHRGVPRRSIPVARYITATTRPLGAPRAVRVARRGDALVIRWRAPRHAARQAVHVRSSAGESRLHVVGRRTGRLVVRGFSRSHSAVVRVAALDASNRRGPVVREGVGPAGGRR